MSLPPDLIRAYHRWRRLDASFPHLAMGQHNSPLYGVENDLDHLHSSLCSEIDELMTGARRSHRSQAGESLAVLAHVEEELHRARAADVEKQPLVTYITVTRELVEELERLPSTWHIT